MSSFINLHIVVPEVHIDGASELHVDMGSIINLLCIIEKVCHWSLKIFINTSFSKYTKLRKLFSQISYYNLLNKILILIV